MAGSMSDHVELIVKRLEKLARQAKKQVDETHKYEVRLRSHGRHKAYSKAVKLIRGVLTKGAGE